MRAKRINEDISFERNQDPKKALKIGSGRYKYPPRDIEFESGSSDSGTAKISCRIKGLKPRWYGMWYGSGEFSGLLKNEIAEFLNSPEIKDLFAQKLNKVFGVNEAQNFKRGLNPKKSLNIGLNSKNYVKLKLEEKGFVDEDDEGQFWDLYGAGFEDWSVDEIVSHVIDILDHGDPKNMMKYMDAELDNYFQMREEFDDEG